MKKFNLFVIFAMACLFIGCEEPNKPIVSNPLVTTIKATQIHLQSAVVGGNVIDDGGFDIVERGVCYSTSANPSILNTKIVCGRGIGEFTCDLTNLEVGTKYYIRAYATNSSGTFYGEEKRFVTFKILPEAVDLGLSVKWATCNVGASCPEDYGDYFAWGETEPKDDFYNWIRYKWCNGNYNNLTKYCNDSNYGIVDNKTTLELNDDAAYSNWGEEWRMPTKEELYELVRNCSWTWTNFNNTNGYHVTGPNGNSIFIPAAGEQHQGRPPHGVGETISYWSSSIAGRPDIAISIRHNITPASAWTFTESRYTGISIRPVCR